MGKFFSPPSLQEGVHHFFAVVGKNSSEIHWTKNKLNFEEEKKSVITRLLKTGETPSELSFHEGKLHRVEDKLFMVFKKGGINSRHWERELYLISSGSVKSTELTDARVKYGEDVFDLGGLFLKYKESLTK